ncbi:putative tagatose 1,6-diphosphate aldolase [Candidatus Promineifilum breve]|uniref:Tagatose 1,6-diphosphate aldolase n=1 Tax=Candidatus Promineifilum breve TaxID=1806508 RepID=A0A160T6R0_9CHLR|nr:tagatose 1,6-diphosphate aldolase [Candidatus Promineifilum breve]CUS05714.1 putative tagatose 1,6-diphosphate aldolase [Candidatus Promineifilum breve]
MSLTIGKLRRLQQCSTPDGLFVIVALDHRDDLRRLLKPVEPESLSYAEMAAFKSEVVRALAPVSSAVVLDPEFGAGQAIAAGSLPGHSGLLVTVEAAGYGGTDGDRRSTLLDDWGVDKVARMGASAVKMRIYYHPEARHAAKQEALVDEIVAACRAADLPLFLEPLSYSLDAKNKTLPSAERRAVVVETARRLSARGIDVLKAEFPLDPRQEPRRGEWEDACRELTEASAVPWVLLSGGVPFKEFSAQTEIACRHGASGVVVGRAVWQEAAELRNKAHDDFLSKTAIDRMVQLGDLIAEHATPWTKYYASAEDDIGEHWFRKY